MTIPAADRIDRASVAYDASASARFLLSDRSYTQQYSNIYFNRLIKLRPHVQARAERVWRAHSETGTAHAIARTLDIQPGASVWFIATLCWELPLKPSILDDVAVEYGTALPPAKRDKIYGPDDKLAAEDEYGRVLLDVPPALLERLRPVTGVVAAVLGSEDPASGAFKVADMCFAGLDSPLAEQESPSSSNAWIALVSGLHCGAADADPLAFEALVDVLCGNVGADDEIARMASVSRLFVLGNTISSSNDNADTTAYTQAERVLAPLAATMDVTVLPGAIDPATRLLPQQPLQPSLLGEASKYSSFSAVSNPAIVDCDGATYVLIFLFRRYRLALTSGQTLDDVSKYLPDDDRLEMTCRFLEWRHLAPTAPDTLWCYPYREDDPLVLETRPRLFAIGNQPQFATTLYGDDHESAAETGSPVRVVLVPEFKSTGTIVFVHLGTLETETVTVGKSAQSTIDELLASMAQDSPDDTTMDVDQ
ncbi:DNA polymerase alpha/epsilon subunit B-domain-containing protein [Blastocladiella britannica]|nr:DNA polymerase alpha/epsilon subunit B-domain-containing protein [Blastocladiella britannica]